MTSRLAFTFAGAFTFAVAVSTSAFASASASLLSSLGCKRSRRPGRTETVNFDAYFFPSLFERFLHVPSLPFDPIAAQFSPCKAF